MPTTNRRETGGEGANLDAAIRQTMSSFCIDQHERPYSDGSLEEDISIRAGLSGKNLSSWLSGQEKPGVMTL